MRETASSPAKVNFRDGSASGQIIWMANLGASESLSVGLDDALQCAGGCYVEVVSGTVEGVLFVP